MMDCKIIENNIWEYIEGSLDETQQKEFAEHIAHCTACAAMEKGLRSSLLLIDQSKKKEADPFFYSRLEARMESAEQNSTSQIPYALRYAMAASVAFIAIIGGSLFGRFSAEQINNDFAKNPTVEQSDDFGFEIADNSFDLIKDFE